MTVHAAPAHGLTRQPPPKVKRQVHLAEGHAAIVGRRTLYPSTVRHPGTDQVLKSGINNRKIGRLVTKGKWKGMPIYTLTLEERATCPSTCKHWTGCYGNKMHMAQRFRHGADLNARLFLELMVLQRRHPQGFVVRLHVLGDFYDANYVRKWGRWLGEFPALHVFGFTARMPGTAIGDEVTHVTNSYPDRWWIRLSDGPGMRSTVTAAGDQVPADAVLCPYETGRTSTCGTCGLCWSTAKRIAFLKQ